MRSIVFSCLLIVIFGVIGFGQAAKTDGGKLPVEIANWSGQDANKILDNPVIKIRLKKLLGEVDYETFSEYFETSTPIKKAGDLLFASGCMIHACTHLESAIAIDSVKNTIHVAIYDETDETKYFNEREGETPEAIVSWAKRFEEQQTDDAESKPEAILMDSFSYGNREEMMLRIDNYLNDLKNDLTTRAFIKIIGKKPARAKAEKEIREYIERRGFESNRLVFLNVERDSAAEIELWVVSAGG